MIFVEVFLYDSIFSFPHFRHWPDVCGDDADKRDRAFKVYQENRRNQKDLCPNTCLNTNVFFGPLVSGRNEKDKAVGTSRHINFSIR